METAHGLADLPDWRRRARPAARIRGLVALAIAGSLASACAGDGIDGTSRAHVDDLPALEVDGDAYVEPRPLPAGKPGRMVAATEIDADWVPRRARAWRVLYLSTGIDEEPVSVSGLLVAPGGDAPRGGFPVLAWAHGTVGLADQCAPSLRTRAPSPALGALVDAGWVVVATDYEGLGTSGLHPYLVGKSAARSVLDGARAAAHAGASRQVVVWGHSQGGHAALWAAELAADYAPALDVAGVVASAPGGELADLLEQSLTSEGGLGFLAMAGFAYADTYPDIHLHDLVTEKGRRLVPDLDRDCAGDVLTAWAAVGRDAIVHQPLDIEAVARRVAENTPGHVAPAAPLLVVQGDDDVIVPAAATDATVDRLCGLGATLVYQRYEGADHTSVIGESRTEILRWIAERRDGEPAPSTCDS